MWVVRRSYRHWPVGWEHRRPLEVEAGEEEAVGVVVVDHLKL